MQGTAQVLVTEGDKIAQEVLSRLDALAAKLGIGAGYLWQMYLGQAKVVMVTTLFELLLWLIVFIAGFVVIIYMWRKCLRWHPNEDHDGKEWACIGLVALSIVWTMFALCVTNSDVMTVITCWLNPSYWAFQQIITQLKQ